MSFTTTDHYVCDWCAEQAELVRRESRPGGWDSRSIPAGWSWLTLSVSPEGDGDRAELCGACTEALRAGIGQVRGGRSGAEGDAS